jgi:hypothetical protein
MNPVLIFGGGVGIVEICLVFLWNMGWIFEMIFFKIQDTFLVFVS